MPAVVKSFGSYSQGFSSLRADNSTKPLLKPESCCASHIHGAMNWRECTPVVLYLALWVLLHILMYSEPMLTTKEVLIMQKRTVDSEDHSSGLGYTNGENRELRAKRFESSERFQPSQEKRTKKAEPIILLLSEWGRRSKRWGEKWTDIPNTSTMHLQHCPHKCRYTLDWAKYEKTADLVIAPTFYWSHYDHLRQMKAKK